MAASRPLDAQRLGMDTRSTLIVWGTLLYDVADDKIIAAAVARLGTGRSPA